MPEFSQPLPPEPSRVPATHPVHRATALLQEALHESRRATFTQEFGEIRGIHRLSAPPAAEVLVDTDTTVTDFVPPPINRDFVGAYLGQPLDEARGGDAQVAYDPDTSYDEQPSTAPHHDGANAATAASADKQLRGLIQDFKERQRKAGLIVAGSVVSAVSLTIVTIALVFAFAT